MGEKITIIEGPPPTFEATNEQWTLGLNESPTLAKVVITRLRTFNGPALVERCYHAWRNGEPIHLEFRTPDGSLDKAPIMAARFLEMEEGHVLMLWVRLPYAEVEYELGEEDWDEGQDELGDPWDTM
jgi:hypothetical protein